MNPTNEPNGPDDLSERSRVSPEQSAEPTGEEQGYSDAELEALLADDPHLLDEIVKLQKVEFGHESSALPQELHLTDDELQHLAEGGFIHDLSVREHLRSCQQCQTSLQQYKSLFELLNESQPEEPRLSEGFRNAVLQKVRRIRIIERRQRSPIIPISAILVGLASAIGYLGLAAGGATVWEVLERGSTSLADRLGWTLANMPTGLWAAVVLAVYFLIDLLIQRQQKKTRTP